MEDLSRLYSGLQAAEADMFAATDRAIFERRYRELQDELSEGVSIGEFHTLLQQFAALTQHAHTRIEGLNPDWSGFISGGGKIFPLDLLVDNGEVIVAGAPEGSAVQPGDRILSLDGAPNSAWLSRLTRNISAETPELAYAQMANGAPYFVWLEYGPRDAFSVEIERGGETQKVQVNSIAADDFYNISSLETGFSLDGREAKMLSGNVAYLRPGAFHNLEAKTPEESYAPEALAAYTAFLDEAFSTFIEAEAAHLILDLRDNAGGDNSFSDPLVVWFADEPFRFASEFRIRVSAESIASNQARLDALPPGSESISHVLAELYAGAEAGELVPFEIPVVQPREGERFKGHVHVLVNRYSYSNAVTTAALIQDYGFGTVYGEPTRDMATTYASLEHFTLPHSGFSVGYAKAHIIRPSGVESSHPLEPDVRLPVQPVRGELDVMLRAMLERLQSDGD